MYVAAHSHYGGGVEHRVDAGLGVVAHNKSAELKSGAQEPVGGIVPKLGFGIVVLEV